MLPLFCVLSTGPTSKNATNNLCNNKQQWRGGDVTITNIYDINIKLQNHDVIKNSFSKNYLIFTKLFYKLLNNKANISSC